MGRKSHSGTPIAKRNQNKPKVDLYKHSVNVILKHQLPNGAYPASPSYETYRYCWFRDGSYNAYAMDVVGQQDSAKNFYNWSLGLIVSKREKIEAAISQAASSGKIPSPENLIDARYHPADGSAGTETDWGNFQLDGLGTLLWAVLEYTKRNGALALPQMWHDGVSLLARYLEALWHLPCYDCWEEDHEKIHVSTLVAIYGGLTSAAALLQEPRFAEEAAEVKQFVLTRGLTPNGALAKHIGGGEEVDAALVHAAVPYNMLDVHHPVMLKTVAAIEELRHDDGGVHRYHKDTFYGGGEWLLLTAYLGWYYVHAGRLHKASELMQWIEGCARENGDLPEQVSDFLNDESMLDHWEQKWGEVACPLLWSHGAYLTLAAHMKAARVSSASASCQLNTATATVSIAAVEKLSAAHGTPESPTNAPAASV